MPQKDCPRCSGSMDSRQKVCRYCRDDDSRRQKDREWHGHSQVDYSYLYKHDDCSDGWQANVVRIMEGGD